jgi:hypothetical protein
MITFYVFYSNTKLTAFNVIVIRYLLLNCYNLVNIQIYLMSFVCIMFV